MSLVYWLYIVNVLHNVEYVLSIFLGITLLFTFVLVFGWMITNDGYSKDAHEKVNTLAKSYLKKWWVIVIILIMLTILPSQRTMYLMLGSSFLQQSNLPTKVSEALELKLDDIIKDLKHEKESST